MVRLSRLKPLLHPPRAACQSLWLNRGEGGGPQWRQKGSVGLVWIHSVTPLPASPPPFFCEGKSDPCISRNIPPRQEEDEGKE